MAAEAEAARHGAALAAARRDADAALSLLREAEGTAQALGRTLAERVEAEALARTRLDAARAATVEQQLAATGQVAEARSLERDRQRVAVESQALRARIKDAARVAALPVRRVGCNGQ